MRTGGYIDKSSQTLHAWLHAANAGKTLFEETRWWRSCWDWWVVDVAQTDQMQRIQNGEEFLRKAGVAALYRPGLRFEEWQEKGESADESWILFSASGELRDALLELTNEGGYCHFYDPEKLIANGLQVVSEWLFFRKGSFKLSVQGTFLSLLAQIVASHPLESRVRVVGGQSLPAKKNELVSDVEDFILARIEQPLQVGDLAKHLGLGLSSFAHNYRGVAGETPYRTILRLKMEAAKYMLIDEGLSVKETAVRLGYSNEFNFSRSFKRMEGQSPSVYVRAMTVKRAHLKKFH